MAFYFKCPSCGHKHRLSEEWLGKEMKCMACGDPFPISARAAGAVRAESPAAKEEKIARTSRIKKLLYSKLLGDSSAAIDGALPGALSGVLAGVHGAILHGIVSGQDAGEIIGRSLIGFVIGFSVGTLLGAVLHAGVKRMRPSFRLEHGIAVLVGGALVGSVVVVLAANYLWIPLGAAIGGAGADLWLMFSNRMEAAIRLPSQAASEEQLLNGAAQPRRSQRKSSRYSAQ